MKFTVERDALLRALDHAQRIVVRQDAIPILNTVWVGATAGQVRIRATNMDMLAETTCPADIETGGEACVSAHLLFKLLQRLPAGSPVSVDGTPAPGKMEIRCRRSQTELPTLGTADFPDLGIHPDAPIAEIAADELAKLLGIPAHIPKDDSPYTFGAGVHLHALTAAATLCAEATDNKRVTRVMLPLPDGFERLPPITLARKPTEEIVRLCGRSTDAATVQASEHALSVSLGGTRIVTKLIDCRFPDLSPFFPASYDGAVALAAKELDGALHRALVLVDDTDLTVNIAIADGSLSIGARGVKAGAVSETMDVDGTGEMQFGCNAARMREALKAIDADLIEMIQVGTGQPIVMRGKGSDAVSAFVMPLRV